MGSFIIFVGVVLLFSWAIWQVWKDTSINKRLKVAATTYFLGCIANSYITEIAKLNTDRYTRPVAAIMALWLGIEALLEYRRRRAMRDK